mmetsp:Transcript_92872/g.174848  ORF Transcript_92872/g.174848 Transcript_92872/m.174848 type:complete len:555 (-) Transcript_92872:80-1744(-)
MQRAWLREFNSLGLQLRPGAAKLVTAFLREFPDPQQTAEQLVVHVKEYFKTRQDSVDPIIDEKVIQQVIICMEEANQDGEADGVDPVTAARDIVDSVGLGDGIEVYNLMTDMRPLDYRRASKEWVLSHHSPELFPGVSSKIKIYADRYMTLWQRLLIQGKLVPEVEAVDGGINPDQRVLTPVESLVGNPGRKLTFGLISRAQEEVMGARRWVIEDLHKAYPLEFEDDTSEWDHQLVTDGSFVLAEGELQGGRFLVKRLEMPTAVTREMSLDRDEIPVQCGRFSKEQIAHLALCEEQHGEGFYVTLCEVHLDSARVLEKLSDLFQGYEDNCPPLAYIFMGSFTSKPFVPTADGVRLYREGFERLKVMMHHMPNHVERGTRFVFMPGPKDPGAQLLPRPPLTAYLTADLAKDIPNVILTTNPCRIRHFSRDLVFFRHDVLKLLRRHEVVPLRELGQVGAPSPQHVRDEMVRLLFDQAHLVPLPLQESNILWSFDHTLRLYPLPDAVFIGGVSQPFECTHYECDFASVGPFYRDASFVSYKPVEGEMVPCDVPDRAG